MNDAQSRASETSFPRSACPVTNTLDIIGDKWTLLVIRDLLLGKHLYGEMMQSPEGIASNILSNRLQRLEQAGLIVKRPYQSNPVRYEYHLTAKGQDLQPVLQAIVAWARRHVPGVVVFPEVKQDERNEDG
jgi:DNA-binding HxlR family transcriptional regulator